MLNTNTVDMPKLLVVDDDPVVRGMLQRLLEEQGYKVATAENGEQAVLAVANHLPELILMDASMPVMDGFSACRFLHEQAETSDIPVVMITALHDSDSVDEAYQAGAVEYITKPINWPVLRHRVSTLLTARQSQAALEQSEARFRSIYEHSAIGIAVTDAQGHILAVNPALQKILGYSEEELCTQFLRELFLPAQNPVEQKFLEQLQSGKRSSYQVNKHFFREQHRGWARLTISLIATDNSEADAQSYLCMVEDITAQNRARAKQRVAARVFEATTDGVIITDAKGLIIDVNQAFSSKAGYQYEELLQQPFALLLPEEDTETYDLIWQQLLNTGGWKGELHCRFKDASLHKQKASIAAVQDEQDDITAYVAVFSSMNPSASESDESVDDLACHSDKLTGLPKQTYLHEQLLRVCRDGEAVALLYIDLDNLPFINDNFGNEYVEQFLQATAQRLLQYAQSKSLTARLDNGKLALVLSPIAQAYEAQGMADKLAEWLSQPLQIDKYELSTQCHIGISFQSGVQDAEGLDSELLEERVDALIQHADLAVHLAKDSKKTTYQVFSEIEDIF